MSNSESESTQVIFEETKRLSEIDTTEEQEEKEEEELKKRKENKSYQLHKEHEDFDQKIYISKCNNTNRNWSKW